MSEALPKSVAPVLPVEPIAVQTRGDLFDIMTLLLRRKWVIVATAIASSLLMLLYLNVATYRYTAVLKVASAQIPGSGLSSSLSKLGGLASLADLQLPQDVGSIAFLRYGEMLHSADLAAAITREPEVMHVLFESEWDAAAHRWVAPAGVTITAVRTIKSLLGIPTYAWAPPDAARVQDYLDRWVNIVVDQKRPLIAIEYRHRDRAFAARFVFLLHRLVDDKLRQDSLMRSERNISYLSHKLEKITLAENRTVLGEALGDQERTQMMAQAGVSFAADPVGQVKLSPRPTSPLPGVYLAAALAGGLLLGSLGVLVRARLAAQHGARAG